MRTFISFSHRDRPLADALRDVLLSMRLQVFLSAHAEDGIQPGQPWFERITGELRQSDALVLVATASSIQEQWPLFEAGAVFGRSKPVLIACFNVAFSDLPRPLQQLQAFQLLEADGQRRLTAALPGASAPDPESWARITTLPKGPNTNDELAALLRALRDVAPGWQSRLQSYLARLEARLAEVPSESRAPSKVKETFLALEAEVVRPVIECAEVLWLNNQYIEARPQLMKWLQACVSASRADIERLHKGVGSTDFDVHRLLLWSATLRFTAFVQRSGNLMVARHLLGERFTALDPHTLKSERLPLSELTYPLDSSVYTTGLGPSFQELYRTHFVADEADAMPLANADLLLALHSATPALRARLQGAELRLTRWYPLIAGPMLRQSRTTPTIVGDLRTVAGYAETCERLDVAPEALRRVWDSSSFSCLSLSLFTQHPFFSAPLWPSATQLGRD